MSQRWKLVAFAVMCLWVAATGCSSDSSDSTVTPPSTAEAPSSTPTTDSPATTPAVAPPPAAIYPESVAAIAQAPLGTYAVAKPGAGLDWTVPLGGEADYAPLAIPVHDEPGGPTRMLVYRNTIDAVPDELLPLLNWSNAGSPLVLRVIAGGPDDEYIAVQAPTRPHEQVTWVQSTFFDFGYTSRRIEIDLANEGSLTLFDGDNELLTSGIVQGRDSRETPAHLTYLESGIDSAVPIPVYGSAMLSMASWSEVLGTFGGGNTPKNYLHGTNLPDLMGERISSGEVRLPNDTIDELITLVTPGTPIIIFDSSLLRSGRDAVLAAPHDLAATVPFDAELAVSVAVQRQHPQIWQHCDAPDLICSNEPPTGSLYAVARDLERTDQIPVYASAGDSVRRTLLDINAIDGTEQASPLYALTPFGQPLVLPIVDGDPQSEWLRVQVPVRPNGSTAWVRADDFRVETTDIRIEVDVSRSPTSEAGILTVFRGTDQLLQAPVASGRDSRPTPLGTGWVHQIVDGSNVGPAYGARVIDFGMHSEALGTFGGGVPRMAVHGTSQPATVGQRVSSGAVRLDNETITQLAEIDGLLGAPVSIFDGAGSDLVDSFQPATTTTWLPDAEPLLPSFI